MTRSTYAPSGRADLPALLPHALLLFCAAGLLAAGYAALVAHNAYAVGYVWLLPAGVKAWLVRGAVRDARCRSPALAAGLCAAAGLLALLLTYHIDQCSRWGVGWDRVDRLPGYVTFRMETDGWWARDTRMPLVWPLDPAAAPGVVPHVDPRVEPSLHWLAFACEAAVLVVWPAGLAWALARRPYSERLRAWFQEEGAALTPASADVLRAALRDGHVADWADRGVEKTDPPDDYVRLKVWYCPRPADGDGVEPEVYVTVGSDAPALLTPEEVAAVAEVFPALHDWAEVPVELREAGGPTPPPPPGAALAHFTRVPAPHAGRCKDPGVKWVGRLLATGVMLRPLAVWAAVLGLTYPVYKLASAAGAPDLVIVYVVGVGVAYLLLDGPFRRPAEDATLRFFIRYYHGVMLRQARLRPDALFDADRRAAVYAEVIPRRVWADLAAGAGSCEAGLLLVDVPNGRLLFEGDRHRWVVPFAAVRSFEVEIVSAHPDIHAVVLRLDTADGVKELPVVPTAGVPGADVPARAAALHEVLSKFVG